MALSKAARIWIIILAIPVTLLIVAVIVEKIYFTSDRLKALVVPQIEEATHRRVVIKDISLSVFPSIAVSVDGLVIYNHEGTKFDHEEFLALDNLSLDVKLFPLISSKVEVDKVVLNHPQVFLEVSKAGEKNYSEKRARKESLEAGKSKETMSGEFLLANLQINNGEISFVNKKFDSRILLTGLTQSATAEAHRGENSFVLQSNAGVEKLSYGSLSSWYLNDQPLTASSKLTYKLDSDVLSFDDVTGKLKDLPFTVTGTVSQLRQDTLMMDIGIHSSGAKMEQLLSLVPPEMLKKARGLQSSGTVQFDVAIKGPSTETIDPGTTASFTVTEGKIQYASLPKSINNITLAGSFEKPSAPVTAQGIGSFSLEKFSASLGTSDLSGKLRMTDFKNPTVLATFNGTVNLSEVPDYYPLEAGSEFSGIMKANVTIDGKAKMPESMHANGSVAFQDVTIKTDGSSRPIRNLNGVITFNNQVVASKQLALKVGESDMNLAFTLRNYLGMIVKDSTKSGTKPEATLSLTSHQLRTADLISGKPTADDSKENTKASKKQGGLLPGIDVAADVSIDKLITEKFTFDNAHGSLTASNGVVNLKNIAVNAFRGSIGAKGMLDLRDASKSPFDLDLAIHDVESNALLPNFTSFGNFLFGKLSMNTKLKGDLNDTLGLDRQSLAGDGAVKVLEGKLSGFPLTEKLSSFTGLTELREVNFKDWANAFSISNGRFNVKGLKVHSGQTDFLMEGSQGLDGTFEYSLTVKLPAEVSNRLNLQGVGGELLQYLKDKDGRIGLAFQVGGTASNPTLRLDTQAQQEMAKHALEQKGAEAKNKLEDDLKKKAEEGLKKLFKRP